MSRRSTMVASVVLVVFGCLAVAAQLRDYDSKRLGMASVIGSFFKGEQLAQLSDIARRDSAVSVAAGADRQFDLELPPDARVFMTGMSGPTNSAKAGHYYYLTYYLFPRDVEVTLDRPRITVDGIQGRSTDSDQEMLTNGFDVRLDLISDEVIRGNSLHPLATRTPTNPAWFDSPFDASVAFLLPLLTALSGVWLLRLLFGSLAGRLQLAEQLACGFGLGMMAVTAFTLGVKLCGFHGRGWVLALTAAGGLAELWRDRKIFLNGMAGGYRRIVSDPAAAVILAAGLAVFLILFRLAALQGIVEFDAVANWMFKAKIFFLCTGHGLVGWFSNPRLAYAHLDYPTLVPSLHAATFDSIGHVDEFVTKFWPAWMLLFLLASLGSSSRGGNSRFHPPHFFLLGVLLLPFTQAYVQMEGGTMPMVFFTVMGFTQCALGLVEKDPARLGLGLTLLFGAAMTKFEGAIFMALMAGWMMMMPAARPSLKTLLQFWRVPVFCFLMALPFLCLRMQIPSLNFESGWAGYALDHPGATVASALKIFLIILARLFVSSSLAEWSVANGQLHWTGQWDGLSSLYNHLTFGLAWVGLAMTIVLWIATPARRPIILWTLAVFVSALITISVVFASFVSINGLDEVISKRIADNASGRYLFPMLLAWTATMIIMFFGDFPPPATAPNDQIAPVNPPDGTASSLETAKA